MKRDVGLILDPVTSIDISSVLSNFLTVSISSDSRHASVLVTAPQLNIHLSWSPDCPPAVWKQKVEAFV